MDSSTFTASLRDPGLDARDAVDFELLFEPVVALASGRIAGLEVLVSWPDRQRGAPHDVVGESSEDEVETPLVARRVVRRACESIAGWGASGVIPPDTFFCVAATAREVREAGFVGAVEEALAWSGVAPSRLLLLVGEESLGRAVPATVSALTALRGVGVRVVIDDFGTGQLALSHLRAFVADGLKIADELVQLDPDARHSGLARGIVALGDSLGMATMADGIETSEQAERMRAHGCTFGQGPFFARPLAAGDIEAGFDGLATDHRWRSEGPEVHDLRRRLPRPIATTQPDAA